MESRVAGGVLERGDILYTRIFQGDVVLMLDYQASSRPFFICGDIRLWREVDKDAGIGV